MKLNFAKLARGAAAIAIVVGTANVAHAQTVAPASDQASEDSSGVDEIIVTAQKRAQNAQDVPIAISALSGDQMAERGITEIRDIVKASPGVLISEYGASPSITSINIRGVALLDFGDQQEAPNAVYVDNAYVSFPGASGAAMFDVQGLEILRGPQGTLFGRNATGGLINVVSRKPTDVTEGYMQGSYGSYNRLNLEGAVGGPLADGISTRVSFSYNRQDGYYKNRLGPNPGSDETLNARFQLKFKLGEDTENLVQAYYSRSFEKQGVGYIPVASVLNADGLTVRSPGGQAYTDYCNSIGYGPSVPGNATNCFGYVRPANFNAWDIESPHIGLFARTMYSLTNTLKHDFGSVELTSITNYFNMKKTHTEEVGGEPGFILGFNTGAKGHQFSQELRLNGSSERLEWVAGLYYLDIQADPFVGYIYADHATGSMVHPDAVTSANVSQNTKTYAAFAQLEYKITDQLSVIAGLRGNVDEKNITVTSDCVINNGATCGDYFSEDPGVSTSARHKKTDWSGRLQLTYKVTPDAMIYAGVNRGTKGSAFTTPLTVFPGYNVSDGFLRPETLTAYEAGFKTSWLDRRLQINGSAFYYNYKDMQAYKNQAGTGVLFNADARNYGGELEVTARPLEHTTVSAGLALLHTSVKNVEQPNGSFIDQKAAFAPGTSLNVNVSQDIPTSVGTFRINGGMRYVSSHFFTTVNEPMMEQSGYAVFDAGASWTSTDEKTELAVQVANIGNKEYAVYGFSLAGYYGYSVFNYGAPRWMTVKLSRKF